MAPAVDQGPLLSWQGEDVALKSVLDELQRLEGELARSEARSAEEQPRPRTSVMNLIAISRDAGSASLAGRVLDGLAVHHPSRVLILQLEGRDLTPRVDAEVLVGSKEFTPGVQFPFERIALRVAGPPVEHLANLVEPFLQPDLPTHVWWLGDPPAQEKVLLEAVPSCATLLVDSAAFSRPYQSFLTFAELVRDLTGPMGVEDLQWARLHPWREVLAQFFALPNTRSLIQAVRGVGVEYVGRGRGNRVAVALLVGWLASALDWRLQRAIGDASGRLLASLTTAAGDLIEVGCQPREEDSLKPGEIAAIRLHADREDGTASIVAERQRHNPHQVTLLLDVDGKVSQHLLAMTNQGETELLIRSLMLAGRDHVYIRSLEAAGSLMKALE